VRGIRNQRAPWHNLPHTMSGTLLRGAPSMVCAAAFVLSAAGCGNSPAGPSGNPSMQAATVNEPPVIHSIAVSRMRAEADQPVQVTAFVSDAETPVDRLLYEWTAAPAAGTFVGDGPVVDWRPPRGSRTPETFTLTLKITEMYAQGSRTMRNGASSTVQMHYNDSSAEITALSLQFLKDFSTYNVSPAECVRNFSDSCEGKSEELGDITYNRQNFQILDGDYHVQSITYNGDRTFASVTAPCTFHDIPRGGSREQVDGTCSLTAVYENWAWWLCKSNFVPAAAGTRTIMGRALMR
jgi:hypothetical protein